MIFPEIGVSAPSNHPPPLPPGIKVTNGFGIRKL